MLGRSKDYLLNMLFFCALNIWLLCCFSSGLSVIEASDVSDIKIVGNLEVSEHKFVRLSLEGKFESAIWEVEPEEKVDWEVLDGGKRIIFVAPPGEYVVRVFAIDFSEKKFSKTKVKVVIKKSGVNGDVPPTPTPGKLSVMVIYDPDRLDNYGAEQAAIFTSKEVREYLEKHCDREGDVPTYRFLSDKADVVGMSEKLRKWYEEAKKLPLPSLVISNGRDVWAGPLPKNVEEFMKVLRKYGGD